MGVRDVVVGACVFAGDAPAFEMTRVVVCSLWLKSARELREFIKRTGM
jgi:hypothetical protein